MASPFERAKEAMTGAARKETPDAVWIKCPDCSEILFRKEVEQNQWVCVKCSHHFRIGANDYVQVLVDPGTFEERFDDIRSVDPLDFKDSKRYRDRLKAMGDAARRDAVLTGVARIEGLPFALAVMDFTFMGGSMGSVVGEKLSRLAGLAYEQEVPLVIVSCSGGARMQEGILSLMQMAKTSAQLARLAERGVPYISVLTDPTTGGVTASFAMLGDVILAEPKALIGFAGPRVIEQTIQQELPRGFQRSEFLRDHGMVDRIVSRRDLRSTLGQILHFFRDAALARP